MCVGAGACEDADGNDQCPDGTRDNAGVCASCGQTNVKKCTADAATICMEGFTNLDNNCDIACLSGCATCVDADDATAVCETCLAGTNYNNDEGACIDCANNCTSCTKTECETCEDKYFKTAGSQDCGKCGTRCNVCDDADTCTDCEDGYNGADCHETMTECTSTTQWLDTDEHTCNNCIPGCTTCSEAD